MVVILRLALGLPGLDRTIHSGECPENLSNSPFKFMLDFNHHFSYSKFNYQEVF
mgnify:CR=1 FL=1